MTPAGRGCAEPGRLAPACWARNRGDMPSRMMCLEGRKKYFINNRIKCFLFYFQMYDEKTCGRDKHYYW